MCQASVVEELALGAIERRSSAIGVLPNLNWSREWLMHLGEVRRLSRGPSVIDVHLLGSPAPCAAWRAAEPGRNGGEAPLDRPAAGRGRDALEAGPAPGGCLQRCRRRNRDGRVFELR